MLLNRILKMIAFTLHIFYYNKMYIYIYIYIFILWLHPQHRDSWARDWIQIEFRSGLNLSCGNPLCQAEDWTCASEATRPGPVGFLTHCATAGTPKKYEYTHTHVYIYFKSIYVYIYIHTFVYTRVNIYVCVYMFFFLKHMQWKGSPFLPPSSPSRSPP